VSHPWEADISSTEKEVIERSGYGNRKAYGVKPTLIIIDAQYNFFGSEEPIMDQLDRYPTGVGIEAWSKVESSGRILQSARDSRIPVFFTRYVAQDSEMSHESKMNRDHTKFRKESLGSQIIEELKPIDGEIVIDKNYASAFFGTPLINYLVGLNVDTIIIIGGVTSGCVRATAVDASNFGFRVVVVEDCVFDRISISHKASLLDIWMKYGSVFCADEVIEYFREIRLGKNQK
jgi:maleamate amidohydrolase